MSLQDQARLIVSSACANHFSSEQLNEIINNSALLETVVDAAWLVDLALEQDSASYNNLFSFLTLLSDHPRPAKLLLERMEPRILESCHLIDSAAVLNRRQIRANTSLFYRQAKYNIFGEEGEGWARLLQSLMAGNVNEQEVILELIGMFSLDPNRAVDCIIDVATCLINQNEPIEGYLQLLGRLALPNERLAEIVGLKLSESHEDGFWTVVALMIKEGLLSQSDILGYFDHEKYTSVDAFDAALKKLPMSSDPYGFHDAGKLILTLIKPSLDPRVRLFDAFLRTRQLESAAAMMEVYGPLQMDHPPAWFSLSFVVSDLIDQDRREVMLFWLDKLTPFTFVNPTLIVRLIEKLTLDQVAHFLIPILPFLPPFPIISFKLFDLIQSLPYEQRFRVLSLLDELTPPEISRMHAQDVKRILRRVSKENVKQLGRLLGKLQCIAPMTVNLILIEQIKAYDNLIGPIVESLRYSSPLAFDCLLFCLVRELKGAERRRMKEDGMHIAGWLVRVSLFIASICRKYPVDLTPVFSTLTARLLSGNGNELCCLTEIIKQMAGVEVSINTVNEAILEASFGGPLLSNLHSAGVDAGTDTKLNGSMDRLAQVLKSLDPECNLWRALAKQPFLEVFNSEYVRDEVKAQSHAYDTAFESFAVFNCLLFKLMLPDLVEGLPDLDALLAEEIEDHMAHSMLRVKYSVLKHLGPTDFSMLDIQDIYVPRERYEQEITRFKSIACSGQVQPKEKERALSLVLGLEAEFREAVERVSRMDFNSVVPPDTKSVIKRAMMTPGDAVFSAHFVLKMGLSVEPFLSALDVLISALSERESVCYGRFISILLLSSGPLDVSQHLHLFTVFNSALSSEYFIPLRNAILMLTRLDRVFPAHKQIAGALEQRVRLLHDQDTREDVRVLSTRCQAVLATSKERLREDLMDFSVDTAEDEEMGKLAQVFAEIASLASSLSSLAGSPAVPNTPALEEGEHGSEEVQSEASKSRTKRRLESEEEPVRKKAALDEGRYRREGKREPERASGRPEREYHGERDVERDRRDRDRHSKPSRSHHDPSYRSRR